MPSLIATLGANIAPFTQGLQEAKGQAQSAGGGIASAFGGKLAGALAGIVSVGAIGRAISVTAEYAGNVQDLSNRLGISTTAVQEWDYALKQNGSSIDSAAGFFEKLAASRDKALKGNPELIEHYKKLGVSMDMLKSGRTEDIAKTAAKTYELGDPQQLITSLRAVGGKAAGELAAAFRDGLAGLLDEAPLISPEDLASIDRATDAFGRMKAEITSGLAPALAGAAEAAEGLWHKLDAAAGVGMSLLVGTFRELKNLWDNGKIDFGSIKKEAVQMLLDKAMEDVARRDAAKAKADRLAKGNRGGGPLDAEQTDKEKKAEDKAEADERALDERRAKDINKVKSVHEQIAEIQRKSETQGMTAAQKRTALEAEIAKLKTEVDPYGVADDLEIADRQKTIAERESELAGVKDDPRTKTRDPLANQLGGIGGFIGALTAAPELAMLDVSKKSEGHLARIVENTKRLLSPSASADGTPQF